MYIVYSPWCAYHVYICICNLCVDDDGDGDDDGGDGKAEKQVSKVSEVGKQTSKQICKAHSASKLASD